MSQPHCQSHRDTHQQAPSKQVSRRQFAQVVSAGTLLSAIAADNVPDAVADTVADTVAADSVQQGWIDAHVHVWHPDTTMYPLGENFDVAAMQPPSFTDGELFALCRPSGVARIVLIQMSFYEFDHRYMIEVMKRNPGVFSGVSLIDWKAPDLDAEVRRHAELGMRGFRLHSRGDAGQWPSDAGMMRLWRLAAEQGIAICPLINPEDIPAVDALCEKFPGTTVVVDHFARVGLSGTIDRDQLASLCRLARFPQAHVKTSAFYALGKKRPPYTDLIPMIRQVVDAFGPERVMWASDCPFQVQGEHSYEASIGLVRDRIEFLSVSDKQWVLRDTAQKVFFA
jgi:predicted TIM-barrel fold metal-dependent hydrolase